MTTDSRAPAGVPAVRAAFDVDARDPIQQIFATEFEPDGSVYLDGNSLGRVPKSAQQRIRTVVDVEWAQGRISSWLLHDWISLPARVGAQIGRLIGAAPDEVVVGNSTSVNLFNVAASALGLSARRTIVTDRANFPTDLYVLEGLRRLVGPDLRIHAVAAADLIEALDDRTALVVLSHVDYRSSTLLDMAAITAAAHKVGGLVVWDLSHSAGAVPVDLDGCNVDFAVGCTYKYLNGGPGSPAFTYVARRWHEHIQPVLCGWQGHRTPFAFAPTYEPAAGIKRMLCSTPEVLALSVLEASVSLFDRVSMSELHRKSIQLSELFIQELQARCAQYGFRLASPRDPLRRGSHIAIAHEHGYPITQALIERRVIADFRTPDLMRFAFAPLYQRFGDIVVCIDILEEIMRTRAWDVDRFHARASIT